MNSTNNIITTLHTRHQIEQEIAQLLHIQSESEFTAQAERIAARGEQVVSVLLNNLKHATPQMINVLGIIAAFYPDREYVLGRLYDLVADESQPDRYRLAAMLILERHLDEEIDPHLLSSLSDPQLLVKESVQEMLTEAQKNPLILLDYLNGLSDQPEEVLENVVETLLFIGREKAVPILCLLAQDESETLSQAALQALGCIDHPAAARGLQTLQALLPPAKLPLCERSLRKLAFKGVPIAPLPPVEAGWRTLVNAPDGEGNRVVWFFHPNEATGEQFFWGVSIHPDEGIINVYGNAHVEPELLPPLQPRGYVHSLSPEEGLVLYMLETDFEYGRQIVRQGAERTWARSKLLPTEYRLLGTLIWSFAPDDEDVSLPERPDLVTARALVGQSADLLAHPAFHSWFAYGQQVIDLAMKFLRRSMLRPQESLAGWARQLVRAYYDAQAIARLQVQLEASAEWLFRAGQKHLAQIAWATAVTLTEIPPDRHPFTLRMAERGLEFVFDQVYGNLKAR